MQPRCYVIYFYLLLLGAYHSIAIAVDATVSVSWTNSTVAGVPELELLLMTGDNPLVPADALFQIHLNSRFAVDSDAGVNETILAESLDSTCSLSVDTETNTLAVQRSGSGSQLSSGSQIRFKLSGVTNPSRASRFSVGTMEISDHGAMFTQLLELQPIEIVPGNLWNSQLTFTNLLSGRSALLTIHLTPAHSVAHDGALVVYLPYMYGFLSGVTLSSIVGLDGEFKVSTNDNAIWLKRTAASGTNSGEMQEMVFQLAGIVHPALEGSMGPSVLLQTLDAETGVIDQTYVDTSDNVLTKARVVLSSSILQISEGNITGAQYTVSLSAPPSGDSDLTLSIGESSSRAMLNVDPQLVVFSTSNWSSTATITVVAPNDFVASGTRTHESVAVVSHTIISGDSGSTFAVASEMSVHISENDFPAVRLSDRFLTVVGGLRNDSYQISLLSEPSSDVVVHMTPQNSFIETFPDQVVFTASSWDIPKAINVIASRSALTVGVRTSIYHQLTSADANYDGTNVDVFPQSDVLVYYEPLEMKSCVEPCRSGWFPLVNATTGESQCVGCPLGHFCTGSCAVPVPCPKGTSSTVEFAAAAEVCQVCAAGMYSHTEGLATCLVCPEGAFCNNAKASPQPCPPGSYSSRSETQCHDCPAGTHNKETFQSACLPCPKGFYCPKSSTNPVACPEGTYSVNSGATPCDKCTAGFACSDPTVGPVECPSGSYSLAGSLTCTICPSGMFCPSTDQAPQACSSGYYSAQGSTSCKACPRGFECSGSTTSEPMACVFSTYSSVEGTACQPCPAGHSCLDATQPPVLCQPGSYSLDGKGPCTHCPKGYKCATTTEAPVRCADGKYSPFNAVDCLECPAGKYCPQPSSDPISCSAGYYSGIGSTACIPCPAGMECTSPSSMPVTCPSGSYTLGPASPCSPCPAGSACANVTATPTVCDSGTFSAQGQTKCTHCSPGYYCPQTGQAVQLPCLPGTYAEVGATACTTCPAGMQCPSMTQAIKAACEPGTYSLGGQAQCISCPIGHMCPQVDGSQNALCAPGWYSSGGAVQCTICPAGYACPDPSASPPVVCPDGYYSLTGAKFCIVCPAGYACPDPTSKLLVPCAKGTYSTGGASSCTPCPAGFACSFSNSSSVELCQTGFYSTTGSGSCVECPRGYYCDTPNEMPKNCSVGYYSLRASTSCLACDPGYECPRSDQLPQPCPVGYYSIGAVANCRSCSPGYKCSLASTNPTPKEDACPMGGYCNPPTTFFLCPAGTFGNVTAGESIDHACAPCPEGYYCEMGTTPLTRQTCPAGFFCPEGTKRASQNPCPAGTFNPDGGQKSSDVCKICPAGMYCPTGSSQPQSCPEGYYCLKGTGAATQYPCAAGTFSGPKSQLTIGSDCNKCPLGSYCPEASSTPTKCPAGTYNPQIGAAGLNECLACPPGWSCPHVGQSDYVDRCTQGHYCPGGTVLATDHPCLAGTYTESVELIRSQDCTICPLRHACLQGTGGETQTMLDCGAGSFCPNGTEYADQFPCLPGTWSSRTSLSTALECDICPTGKYCEGGKSFIDGSCAPGHYCPLGTYSKTQFPCPSGTFTANTWLFEPSQCDDCPPGYYCPAGSVAPIPCKAGSYTSVNNTKTVGPADAWPACTTCPAGYYCVEASVTPKPCGKGKFSTSGSKTCPTCEAGYFCNSETTSAGNMRSNALGWTSPGALYGTCYNGTYCPAGSDSEPALETDACPPAYYCPTATPAPVICPAGTYSNLTGQDSISDCTPTPAGYFSLAGALEPTGVCSPGFYCPVRSTSRTQMPCPARYYLNRSMGQSEEDCAVCVSGSYCPIGSAYPTTCPAGYYCRTGISSPEPCPIGTYANATGLRTVEDCLQCPPGMYCDSTALTTPRGLCDPGYYCTLGAYTSAPMNYESTLFGVTNRHTGDQCPKGAYCPLGSSTPTLCPPGTFNNFTGLESVGQCVPCPPGEYCETPGLLLPTDSCHPGYFCIGGAAVPTQMETPAGSYSFARATAPSPCPPGQYNLYPAQDKCVVCPAGFYCSLPGTVSPIVCPTGNYCPEGTSLPVKCLPGTFADVQGLVKIDQCEPCPSGQYCDSYGLSAPSGPCLAGFVCTGRSPVSNPVTQIYGDVCPVASYCPEGTGNAISCPIGYFRAATGGTSLTSCSLCSGGQHCNATGLTKPSGSCSSGYYCVSSASSPTPTDSVTGAICPAGFYCPEASSAPTKCSAGTYAANKGQSLCNKCPMGYFCDGVATNTYADCTAGHYCPAGTGEIPVPCPIGTFSNSIRVTNVTECQNCTAGYFCGTLGLVQPTGPCAAGSYCPPRAESGFGRTAENATHVCPAGFYCPEGTYLPIPCPIGTYSNDIGLVKTGDCVYCDEGSYCTDTGLVKPSGLCEAGYYCKRNNTQPNPSSGVVKVVASTELTIYFGGQACPTGSYCPLGSVSPILCPEGSYSDVTTSSLCLACPPGYFCPIGCNDYTINECPMGHYCPESTQRATQFQCPPGSFGNRTRLQDVSQCTPTPGGTYINEYAAVKPMGNCRSGFYCSGGSSTSTPAETTATGGPCLPGTNCPEGSAVPIVCDAGAYCSSTNTDAALPCSEGFYCIQGSFTATPTGQNNSLGVIGDVCKRGHYCPKGTSNPIPCLPGTYSDTTQNADASFCLPCSPGFICSISGVVKPYERCPAGFICTGGESTATQLCPKGSECPEGSSEPRSCPAGTFADEKGLATCKLCPEAYYCVAGSVTPVECPQGYYCPLQTPSPSKYPCLAGSFGDKSGLASSKECAQCPPGKFCSGEPLTNKVSGDCAPGHYCVGGATMTEPIDGVTGGLCDGGHVCLGGAWIPDPIDGLTGRICDPGYYCPQGSFNQIRCAKGTYNSVEKQSVCSTCPAGGYCDTNATSPVLCPLRYYCPKGIENPVFCPNGTYGHQAGLTNATECAPCPAGKFCVAGTITASCTAGFYCKLRNDHPNPMAAVANGASNAVEVDVAWRTELGGPCPIGYYCPEGVLDPIPCPKNSSRLQTLGISQSDCDPCPAGKSCDDGSNTVPCPAGSYCPYGVSEVPCPSGTFNGAEGKAKQEDCLPCDAGKLCNRTGIVDLTDYDCPPGSYCLRGSSEPHPCSAGSYRDESGAKSSTDCSLCVGGSFCKAGATKPAVCDTKTYCPIGSGSPLECPGGSYCPYNTTTPVTCPVGFFCLPAVESPAICTLGHYCPSGTTAQTPCPLGFVGRTTPLDGAYTSLYSSCEACPPGTFGIDVNRTRCDECLEGYVCLGATNSSHPVSQEVDKGYPCSPGSYCPAGSSSEIACPAGTYQPNHKASNESACLLCPANSYQNSVGQGSCLPCSTSAFAAAGATKCTCVGSHRAFQMTDGYCICEPGYEFYDQDMILRSDEDGDVDCQPIVYDRCSSNQVRSDSGSCVPASGKACDASCNNGTGTYVASLGVCQCDEQPDLDTVCNQKCRDESTQIQVNGSTGEVQLYNPITREVLSLSEDSSTSGLVSKVSCSSGSDCQLHSIAVASTGFSGSYDLPPLISEKSRRRLTTASTSSSIANPMVCLSVGNGLLFDLSVAGSYPIYMKDSMLNTNPSFDYGAFRSLASKVSSNSSTVSAFAFSFTEAGTYVFGNSLNSAAQTIVVVMKAGTSCPTEAPIVPLNEKNLITVSAKRRTDDIILAPDWGLIVGLLGGLFGVVIAVIAGLYYFRAKSWTNTAVKSVRGYRAKNKQVNLAAMHSKGTVAVTNDTAEGEAMSGALLGTEPTTVEKKQFYLGKQEQVKGPMMEYHPDLERWDEEDLDLRELVDRLQFHHEAVTKSFEDQKGGAKQLMQRLQAEVVELKRLFVNALVASDLMSLEASTKNPAAALGVEVSEAPETLPISEISGRPRSRSVAGREKFLLENLERDLQDRDRFEQKKTAMLDSVSAGLHEIEGWGAQLAELTGAIVQEMASEVDDRAPEHTSSREESCLEHARLVLDELKALLGSDPMTQTSSSLIHLAEAEKGRREVGNFVLEASQRYFTDHPTIDGADLQSRDPTNEIHRLLDLHDDVEKAQNKEDEALFGPLESLQKFGAALPQVLAAIDDLETSFHRELDAVREEQNPVKEHAVQAQMQSRLSKLMKEVAAGAKRVNEKVDKEAPRTVKLRHGAQQVEDTLSRALGSAKEQWITADLEQRYRSSAAASILKDLEDAPPLLSLSAEDQAAAKLRDKTLFEIKDLLIELTTLLQRNGGASVFAPQQLGIAPQSSALADPRVSAEVKHREASASEESYPQLSAAEKERQLDKLESGLRKIQPSTSTEALPTKIELATRQARAEVVREVERDQTLHRELEDANVLRAQHDEEEQSLESQFREEELAIEQEYLRELSSLQMEFGSGSGDEADGDATEPPENVFDGFYNDMEGDESLPPGMAETEDSVAETSEVLADDNADIIAQLNGVYSQAWNNRVRVLAMEETLRKEQLNERIRRKRIAQKGLDSPLSDVNLNSLMLEAVECKDDILEEIVKKQDEMDALEQQAINRSINHLRKQVEDCHGHRVDDDLNDLHALTELVTGARNSAKEDRAGAGRAIAQAESGLQKLQNEYDHDFAVMKEEIENERMRLEAKLKGALAKKRRRRGDSEEDDETFLEQTESDNSDPQEELETQLEAFTDSSIKELRDKHFQLQQDIDAQKTQGVVAMAVADAKLAYLDELSTGRVTAKMGEREENSLSRLEVTGGLLGALAVQIPERIEQQTQEEVDKLRADYVLSCAERRRELEADAAMRRAKLADKMNRRRRAKERDARDEKAQKTSTASESETIYEQERVALAEIAEGLRIATEASDVTERKTCEALAQTLASTLQKYGAEIERQICQHRQQYEERARLLQPQDEVGAKTLASALVNALDILEDEASQRAESAAQARAAIEREVKRMKDDRSESLAALTHSLKAEKQHQEQRLKLRLAQRREQQQNMLPVGSSPDKVAEMNTVLVKQEVAEKLRLEDQLEMQAQRAFDEELGKQRDREGRLEQQLRDATVAEAAAAAMKEAVVQARSEYLKTDSNDEELAALMRLWKARQPRKPSAPGRILRARQPVMTYDEESAIQRLHEEHDRAWGAVKARLEDETQLRKAQLTQRLQRKRQMLQNSTALSPTERERAEAALEREEERESVAIETSAASIAQAITLATQRAKDRASDIITGSLTSNSADLDAALEATRRQHEEAQRKLREDLETERRKQEQLLRERLRQRRTARRDGTGPMLNAEAEEAEEADMKQKLEAKLCAQEDEAWTALREREQQEIGVILAPLEAVVSQRLDDAELAERRARQELERLAGEHDRHLAELREALEAEKKRQQLALRAKLQRKRDRRGADDVSVSDEESLEMERQAMEALEASFDMDLATAEAEAQETRREKEMELLAEICASSASRTAEEEVLTLLDEARLEAERVRAEYEAALASRLQRSAAADAISREEMAKRLAERKLKRRQQREQQVLQETFGIIKPVDSTLKGREDDGSLDREIANVQAAHTRGVRSRQEQLDAETAARKAALAARLEHKRRTAVKSGESGASEAEMEKALLLEEQQELAAIERDRALREKALKAEAARERDRLAKTMREADESGTADIERQLAACKQAHDAEAAKLEEALRAERARQELVLKQRLAAKGQRRAADGGDTEAEGDNDNEAQEAQAALNEHERVARQQLADRQQQQLADVTHKLEQEAEVQRQAAFDLQAAAERELKRLEEEHARERRALQEALLADKQKREAQLREKLAKKKAARRTKGSESQQDDVEEEIALAALQEAIMGEQAVALAQERERQEAAIRLAAAELQEAAVATAKAVAASRQAQDEAARVAAEFDRHHGETQLLEAAETVQSKRKLADRLAEKKRRQQLKQQQVEKEKQADTGDAARSLEEEAERLRLEAQIEAQLVACREALEAQIEAQLVACREAHDVEAGKLRESLQAERERQESALQERIARRKEKRSLADAQASARVDVKATEEAERKQQQEEEAALAAALAAQELEAWEEIQRKQDEDLRVLQEQKNQQERERAERQQQLAQQEMNRLQEEHERELRALTTSLAQEQARQEEKLQQRIAQRRARKQRQEEEAATTSAKEQQSNADAEEAARLAAERERVGALAEAQAQAEAEAEEKERQEIAARLAQKLEEERARQRREKEELEVRLAREAEEQAAKRAEALALQLQQQALETADKMAREFDTNLRELRETHSADGAAQKARLESRIASKKARKLRELEEKRELERQRLHARQQQEAEEAARAEQEHEAAVAEAERQAAIAVVEEPAPAQSLPVAPLPPTDDETAPKVHAVRQQQPNEDDDLVSELRGRLELEAEDRRRGLEEEKRVELERLAQDELSQIAQVEARVAALLAEERAAMIQLLTSRLQALPAEMAKQRDAAEREHTIQLQRLTLLLEGRGQQQKSRVRTRMLQKRVMVEDGFNRKAKLVTAAMNQRFMQEKVGLRLKKQTTPSPTEKSHENDQEPQKQDENQSHSALSAELVKRLEEILEDRLLKIEALVTAFQIKVQEAPPAPIPPKETVPEEPNNSLIEYRLAIAEAVAVGCCYEKRTSTDKQAFLLLDSFGVLDASVVTAKLSQVTVNQLDDRLRARLGFAELLVQSVATKSEPATALAVVEHFERGNNGDANYASFSPAKQGQSEKGTLFLSRAALQELSTGQLAVVILHAMAQGHTHRSDLTEPQFISHLYKLLVRCYQGLFTHFQQKRATTTGTAELPRKSVIAEAGKTISIGDKTGSGQWQARLLEMEGFLTRMEARNVASPSMLQSQSSRLLSKQREGNAGAALGSSADLWQQEQVQILQEKLDSAEKLYLQVLRQHEQQTQSVEYWQDLLAEQRDAGYEEDTFDEEDEDGGDKSSKEEDPDADERQRQREARAQEAQGELERTSLALEETRRERDELFAQCQQLRDQLNDLRVGRATG